MQQLARNKTTKGVKALTMCFISMIQILEVTELRAFNADHSQHCDHARLFFVIQTHQYKAVHNLSAALAAQGL